MTDKKTVTLLIAILLLSFCGNSQTGYSHRWSAPAGQNTMNGNPAVRLGCGAALLDSVPLHASYTAVAVYRSTGDSAECGVWRLAFGDSVSQGRALTTRRLLLGNAGIRYDSVNRSGPVINCIMQSAPDTAGLPARIPVLLGDSAVGSGGIDLAEFLYFPGRMGIGALTCVQSVLAVKYGVTLGPVDYQTPSGTVIWDYSSDSSFHRRITGVGCDSASGLRQLCSLSGHEGAMLELRADSLPDGCYCLAGDDGGVLEFGYECGTEYLGRTWKVRSTCAGAVGFVPVLTFTFLTGGTPLAGDTLVMHVGDSVYMPTAVTGGSVTVAGVPGPAGAALVRLSHADGLPGMKTMQTGARAGGAAPAERVASVSLYPNPSRGAYTVSVDCGGKVLAVVHDALGVQVASFSGEGRERYTFSGELPVSGVYYVTVTTEGGSQTMKLSVN